MKWFSKDQPLYVWDKDQWENEYNHEIFIADTLCLKWVGKNTEVPFAEKTYVYGCHGWWTRKKGLLKGGK